MRFSQMNYDAMRAGLGRNTKGGAKKTRQCGGLQTYIKGEDIEETIAF
jgi:hypothetical protein